MPGRLTMRQAVRRGAGARPGPIPARVGRVLGLLVWAGWASAAGAAAPQVEVVPAGGIRVVPAKAELRGPDAVQQLAVERVAPDGTARDATTGAEFATSDAAVVTVDAS